MIAKIQNKKGFTLVEVIVVLIILAILAAILVPSLTTYIDKANEKAVIAEARGAYIAAQLLASEAYAESGATGVTAFNDNADNATTTAILTLAQNTSSPTLTYTADAKGVITAFTYSDGTYTATFGTDGWTITP